MKIIITSKDIHDKYYPKTIWGKISLCFVYKTMRLNVHRETLNALNSKHYPDIYERIVRKIEL